MTEALHNIDIENTDVRPIGKQEFKYRIAQLCGVDALTHPLPKQKKYSITEAEDPAVNTPTNRPGITP